MGTYQKAAYSNNPQAVQLLLDYKANPNAKTDIIQATPLYHAMPRTWLPEKK